MDSDVSNYVFVALKSAVLIVARPSPGISFGRNTANSKQRSTIIDRVKPNIMSELMTTVETKQSCKSLVISDRKQITILGGISPKQFGCLKSYCG